jgi:hypothetical protein
MRFGVSGLASHQTAAKNFSDDSGGIARAIDTEIREFVGRQALGMKRAESGLVAKQRASSHGHAAREKHIDWRIEPNYRNACIAEEFRSAGLRVGTAPQGKYRRFFELGSAPECSTQLLRFELAERRFAVTLKKLRDRYAGGFLNAFVKVDEMPAELPGQARAYRAFARTHEASEANYLCARLCAPRNGGLIHNSGSAD